MKVNEWFRYDYTGRDHRKTKIQDRLHFQTILYYLSTMELNEKQKGRLVDVLTDRGDPEVNPAIGLRKFSGTSKKRDILNQEEVKQLFSSKWDDERSRIGNLLAMTTGLRAGEVVALRKEDIRRDTLMVRHSWSFSDGLKAPKNGDERVVPLLPQIKTELLKLL